MKKQINTTNAPAAIGPYSQGFSFESLVFTSGQLPLEPDSMNVIKGGITEQTRQTLTNLQAILEAGGASLDSVLKTTCFLTNMNDFAAFNSVYAEFFGSKNMPARSCVEISGLAKGSLVEIEAIAYIK